MKRFVVVLGSLLVLPAFAEVAPAFYYEDMIDYTDPDFADVDVIEDEITTPAPAATVTSAPTVTSPRSATGRTTISRAMPTSVSNSTTNRTTSASGRVVASRGGATSANIARGTTTRAATTRAATTANRAETRGTVSRAGTNVNSNAGDAAARRNAATTSKGVTARASIVQNDTVSSPLYIGQGQSRVGVRTSSAVSARVPAIRVSSNGTSATTSAVTAVQTTSDIDELAQLTDFCKAQYTQCMDNFCDVLDDNQGRCSCSRNLKNYEKTEQALKAATEELQEVAQKIQYIGLTGDEVETLFTQTEAELKMQSTVDNTQLKTDLDRIKKMIVDVKSGTATSLDSGMSLDLSNLLDFTIDSTGFDLGALFNMSGNNNVSISNQRGESLYKTATARCKAAVLNSCAAQGVDTSIITNAYDLEIDKQCIAYERSLNDSNDQMSSTVRNAKSVLQKARLLVAQQKNQYDLRGCINQLDACMQDEFVCGSDYERCLDPTGKYILDGEIVVGGQPGATGCEYTTGGKAVSGLYSVWDYNNSTNAWGGTGTLGDYINATFTGTFPTNDKSDMSSYIQRKIGYIDSDGRVQGMCASVLNRCQDYTYVDKGKARQYNTTNEVIRGYLERVLVQIKAAQDEVLADYAESCIADVYTCLTRNDYTYTWGNNPSTGVDKTNPSDIAIRACMSVINSCKSVTDRSSNADSVKDWLNKAINTTYN